MQVAKVKINPKKAREYYKAYKSHQAYERPEDYQIMRVYQLIAQGRTIIQALKSIKDAGVDAHGLPRLAICRAHSMWCYLRADQYGNGNFCGKDYRHSNNRRDVIEFRRGFFPENFVKMNSYETRKALVPIVPINLRPKRGLEPYHILFEAEWDYTPPVDPYLLRRIDNSDFWVVLAAWELTTVEQAALNTRMIVV